MREKIHENYKPKGKISNEIWLYGCQVYENWMKTKKKKIY